MKKNNFKLLLLAVFILNSVDSRAAADDAVRRVMERKLAKRAVRAGLSQVAAEEVARKAAASRGSAKARIKVLEEEIARPVLDFSKFGEHEDHVRRFVAATGYTNAQLRTLLAGVDLDGDADAKTENLARVLFLSRIGQPPRNFEEVFGGHGDEVFDVLTELGVKQFWRIFDTVESDGDANRSSMRATAMAMGVSDVVAQEAYGNGILYADFENFLEEADELESTEAKDSHVRTSMFIHRAAGYDMEEGEFRDFATIFGESAREIAEEARRAEIPVAQFSEMADEAKVLPGVDAIARTEHVRAAIERYSE